MIVFFVISSKIAVRGKKLLRKFFGWMVYRAVTHTDGEHGFQLGDFGVKCLNIGFRCGVVFFGDSANFFDHPGSKRTGNHSEQTDPVYHDNNGNNPAGYGHGVYVAIAHGRQCCESPPVRRPDIFDEGTGCTLLNGEDSKGRHDHEDQCVPEEFNGQF